VEAHEVIAALDLVSHPEGGHYRETWADESSTAIYFLLQEGESSAWHRVRARAEVWHFHAGAPLRLEVDLHGPGTDSTLAFELGIDLLVGQRPQVVVPAGAWQSARTLGAWTLAGCTVAPPFTFEAFELAPD
jgi:uncharacterized protein